MVGFGGVCVCVCVNCEPHPVLGTCHFIVALLAVFYFSGYFYCATEMMGDG